MNPKRINIYIFSYIALLIVIIILLGLILPEYLPSRTLTTPEIIALVIFLFIVASPVYYLRWQKGRIMDQNLKDAARMNGWQFVQKLDLRFIKRIANELDIRVDHPLIVDSTNGINGEINGLNFTIFNSSYNRDKEGLHYDDQTVIVLYLKQSNLPLFGLEPKTRTKRILNVGDGLNIDLESDPMFPKNYSVLGDDTTRIWGLLKPEIAGFFRSRRDLSLFGNKQHLIMFRRKVVCPVEDLKNELVLLVEIANMLPGNKKTKKPSEAKAEIQDSVLINKPKPTSQEGSVKYW